MYSLQNSAQISPSLLQKIQSSFPLIHTIYELVDVDNQELSTKLGLSIQDIKSLKNQLVSVVTDAESSLASCIVEEKGIPTISTGDSSLDQFLGESFLSPSLSMISGPPGSGKTQLLLSILSWCLENNKDVLYINCGCDFVLERLCSILNNHGRFSTEILKHAIVENLFDYHELMTCFERHESLFQKNSFGCILIDNITILLQPLLSIDLPNGRSFLSHILLYMRQMAKRFHFPIIMTNQTRMTLERLTKNALNPNINHFIDNKIELIRKEDVPYVYVDKSPYIITPRSLSYTISEKGFIHPTSLVCLMNENRY